MSLAQDISSQQSYEADYFVQFQPNTARDMVRRIPGFALQENEDEERGFGQASINILVNGRRPSSKSSSANDILGRIPADSVQRIEILDGASLNIPGLSGQVANIISTAGKLSGNWKYSARFERGTEPQLLEGEMSVNGTRGDLEYTLSVDIGQFTFTEDGTEQFFTGEGELFEDRVEDLFFAGNRPGADLNLTYNPANDHVANLNLSGQLWNRRSGARERFQAILPVGSTGESLTNSGEDEYNYEIGGDYAFPVRDGTLKLIGLHRFENSEFNRVFRFFEINENPTVSIFDSFDKEGEYILRSEYNWKSGDRHDWQLSAEGAFNFLDSTTEFTNVDSTFSTDNVRVEEQRAEGNITHSWTVSDAVNVQTSLGAEYSQLEVITGTAPARKFFRPKGFVSVSYDANEHYTWRAKVERDVGQLDFGTFVSSVNVSEGTADTGNPDIVPTQFWNAEIELERKGGPLTGTLKTFARYIEDPVDRILFADGSEGPGNLESAYLYGVEANLTWVLDNYGLEGMRLELGGGLRDSAIDDPVTFRSRQINNTNTWEYEVSLTHDIPNSNWAWGLEFENEDFSAFYRRDQSFDVDVRRPESVLRLTHKDIFGIRVDLFYQNFTRFRIERERLIYDGDRNGDLIQREFFSRKRGQRLGISFSDTF